MWQVLHDAWWRLATQRRPQTLSDLLACRVLEAGALLYGGAVALRNVAYTRSWARSMRLPCRVVSVGNLTVGGTGKTTCVEWITKKLQEQGRHVAILSRGYGGQRQDHWLRVEQGRLQIDGNEASRVDGLADEPQVLAKHLPGTPVMVGAQRARTGVAACTTFGCDTLVLDDGFQHRQVARDCDIVLIHARTDLSSLRLFPRGPLREPLTSLARAHVIVITKADEALEVLGVLSERLRTFNREATLVTAIHEPSTLIDPLTGRSHELVALSGMRVGLLSSIGDPAGFTATVQRLHAAVLWHHTFPDHYRYDEADWCAIVERCHRVRPDALITTEKDWVRLQPTAHSPQPTVPLWVLGVQMKILSGERELDDRLARLHAR